VDSRPIKNALSTWAGKWAMAYMDYLQKYITTELDNLIEFIASVNRGLTIEVPSLDPNPNPNPNPNPQPEPQPEPEPQP